MIVGLFGLDFGSENLGCGALAYSFLHLLKENLQRNKIDYNIYVFSQESFVIPKDDILFDGVSMIEYHFKNVKSLKNMTNKMKTCDLIFDFTAGDSFSDIYGFVRFTKSAILKLYINSKTKLILGPQTYGPFNSYLSKILARKIIKNSYCCLSRDHLSREYVYNLTKRDIIETIDVAFSLPYKKQKLFGTNNGKNIGINISGLLWNGGYNQKNQFSMTVDYRNYTKSIIEWLLKNNYTVHLLGHVFSDRIKIENDLYICEEINNIFSGKCIVAPKFKNPMEAKSYISRLDCLIGARMHATIAAISSGCAVIPFAYSRKFNGLYKTLNYNYVIDGCCLNTKESIEMTINYLKDIPSLIKDLNKARAIAADKLNILNEILNKVIKEVFYEKNKK